MMLARIPVGNRLPDTEGKYIVETVSTSLMKTVNRFTARLYINIKEDGSKKHTWDVSNQLVEAWFEELPDFHFS